MSKLKNRIALVTGGARGIGAAIVMRLAEEGANVAINYTSPGSYEKAKALKETIEELFHIQAMAVKANVGIKADVDQMMDEVERELGSVDILVNNAGIAPFEPFLTLSEETWDKTYQTNVKSIYLTTQRAAKR